MLITINSRRSRKPLVPVCLISSSGSARQRNRAADDHTVIMRVSKRHLPSWNRSCIKRIRAQFVSAHRRSGLRIDRMTDLDLRHPAAGRCLVLVHHVSTTYSVSWPMVVSALSTSNTLVPWLMITKRSQTW